MHKKGLDRNIDGIDRRQNASNVPKTNIKCRVVAIGFLLLHNDFVYALHQPNKVLDGIECKWLLFNSNKKREHATVACCIHNHCARVTCSFCRLYFSDCQETMIIVCCPLIDLITIPHCRIDYAEPHYCMVLLLRTTTNGEFPDEHRSSCVSPNGFVRRTLVSVLNNNNKIAMTEWIIPYECRATVGNFNA